ncbi:nucleoside-diphosphate-sugar epimerase [Pasteurella langaaensis DSM 22999]|uniref:Nucleoside-diphosphate-sugar epimerase n=1 Tax=Alitibacter langaaensis DSM 22999 TaxID=1122935 RepID=A0A2U0THE8_9PAST|nr:NAD-dependent epimerase/dehydratase family protein [Pasteurella langaaensis]PVX42958.1 nucleoside-diphosphate-sugar epimerase [Pasteurella langaaensis DSM 22999]
MKDLILEEDLTFILNKVFKQGKFNHSTILVTGATGLIGSLVVKSILYANQILNSQITILASVRNLEKAKEIFADFSDKNLMFITDSLLLPLSIEQSVDFIVHTASITASKEMISNPTAVLLTAFESTKNLLNYMKENPRCKMVYISSMEYYGQVTAEDCVNVTEDKLGYIDLSKPRSCYPESKRVCEALCNAYATQYNLNVCSARLAQTFGAGVSYSDNRVFAQFAKSALNNNDIILHTTGQSEGNYCYTADAVYGIFLLLQKGKKGQCYNVSHSHSTILNMAKLVAEKIGNNKIKAEVCIPKNLDSLGYAPDVKLKLNSDKLKTLGWQPEIDLENMFKRMIRSWELQG